MSRPKNSIRGRKLLLDLFKHQEESNNIPWVPFAGIHAASLKNYTATEVLTDGSKLLESLLEVNRLYHPDGQPITFDLQIEAEILGCELRWSDKSPPMVSSHPLAKNNNIPKKIPQKEDGRLPIILDVMKRFKAKVGSKTALFGLVTGPLTLASHLRGTNLYLDLITRKEYVKELINYTNEVEINIAKYYIDAGMDVIALVDPVVSLISSTTFEEYLLEPLKEFFRIIKKKDRFSSFFVCGDATKNLESMCKTDPDSIFIDENIDMVAAKKILSPFNIIIGGNIPLTSTMLFGSQQDNMKFVVELIDKIGKENLVIAPGCDMPYDVPPENVIGVVQAVHEPELIKRSLLKYEIEEIDLNITLPDYKQLPKPLIEVFTIDSTVCAACGYMLQIAIEAHNELKNNVDLIEYRFTERENITRAKKLGIKHLPCILINGKVEYSSLIPSKSELINKIKILL
ncbi:MAG: uroporphyrinogen decarboxylase family protein [Candidatus Hodarchaeales archaeon]|jgi:uroporphyrinogen decarboxylase